MLVRWSTRWPKPVGPSITDTPSVSGVMTVTITATDPGSLTASTSFTLTVNPAGSVFGISVVQTIRCGVLSAGLRRVTFTPQYTGLLVIQSAFRW